MSPLVYELAGDRYLLVFGVGGRGDIYPGDDFRRFVRWCTRVDEDTKHGCQASVGHWAHFSRLKHRLISNIDALVAQLRCAMSATADELDFSYESLDSVSKYVDRLGTERAQQELYDQLVAYVGEALRARIRGLWEISKDRAPPYPYVVGAKHSPAMPINIVWQELSGASAVNLRAATANEILRKRKPPGPTAYLALNKFRR